MFEPVNFLSEVDIKLPAIPVAEVDAHLRGHAEEPRDEVVRLEDAVLVHQLHEDNKRLEREWSIDSKIH